MSDPLIISPPQMFKVNGENCKVQQFGSAYAVGNQQILAAVTGKIIRVMGWFAQSITGIGQHRFTNGNGGVSFMDDHNTPLGTTAGDKFTMPLVYCGYFECNVSTALYCVVSTNNQRITVQYIVYTPN